MLDRLRDLLERADRWRVNASARYHHWRAFSSACLTAGPFCLGKAHRLTELGPAVTDWIGQTSPFDGNERGPECIRHIYGLFGSTIAACRAIQVLCISGYGLEAMGLLRQHLEAVLTLLYVLEPGAQDVDKIVERVDEHAEWVMVQMKQNADASAEYDVWMKIAGDPRIHREGEFELR